MPLVSEKEFQRSVVEYARLLGWIVGYTHDARKSEPGEPDLRMVHQEQHRFIVAELKTETGRLTKGRWNKAHTRYLPGQDDWAQALDGCPGVEFYLWRPNMWDEIEEALRTPNEQLDQRIAEVEKLMSNFEQENPGVLEALEMIGVTVDEYEWLISGMTGFDIETSSNTYRGNRERSLRAPGV